MIPQKQAGPPQQENSLDRKSPNLIRKRHGPQNHFVVDVTLIIDSIDTNYLYAGLTLHRSPQMNGMQSA